MSEVDLTWNTSPEKDVAFYLVYRDGASVAKISSTLTNWKDTGLKPATYSYQLRALDTFNQMSDYSTPPVSGSPDTTAPSIPANFTASTTFPTSITLNWTASIDPAGGSGLEGYLIIRDGKVKIPVSASPTTYTDELAAGNQPHLHNPGVRQSAELFLDGKSGREHDDPAAAVVALEPRISVADLRLEP